MGLYDNVLIFVKFNEIALKIKGRPGNEDFTGWKTLWDNPKDTFA
jgi:hypothetical protein